MLHENESIAHNAQEYAEQNKILKYKAQQLLQQNEDYVQIVSQLNRYQFHLKDAFSKVQELSSILDIYDEDLEKKLGTFDLESSRSPFDSSFLKEPVDWPTQEKKFF